MNHCAFVVQLHDLDVSCCETERILRYLAFRNDFSAARDGLDIVDLCLADLLEGSCKEELMLEEV